MKLGLASLSALVLGAGTLGAVGTWGFDKLTQDDYIGYAGIHSDAGFEDRAYLVYVEGDNFHQVLNLTELETEAIARERGLKASAFVGNTDDADTAFAYIVCDAINDTDVSCETHVFNGDTVGWADNNLRRAHRTLSSSSL